MTQLGDVLRLIRAPGESVGLFAQSGEKRFGKVVDDLDTELPTDWNVWFSLNPGADAGNGRVTRQSVTRLAALHADLDVATTGKSIASYEVGNTIIDELSAMLGTAPVAVIYSGHGMQPIWGIEHDDVVTGEPAAELLRRWGALVRKVAQAHGGDVDSVFETARLVRAPGTVNSKPGQEPVEANADFTDGRTLSLAEIDEALEQYAPEVTVLAPAAPITAAGLTSASSYEARAVQGCLDRLAAMTKAAMTSSAYAGEPWDATTFTVACRLIEIANAEWSALTPEQAVDLVWTNAPRDEGFGDERVAEKIRSAQQRIGSKPAAPPTGSASVSDDGLFAKASFGPAPADGGAAPVSRGWDDSANAARAAAETDGKLLWLADAETWAEWANSGWSTGTRLGEDAVQASILRAVANEFITDRELDKVLRSSTVSSATIWLRRSRVCTAALAEFDQRPDLLRTPNGVIDLRRGELIPPSPDLKLLKGSAVAFDAQAQCPEFDAWLKHAQPDEDMRDYLQQVIGIALTGEQVKRYWVHEGVADAGKSMLIKLMTKILGDAAVPISDSLIEGRAKVFGDDYHRAALRGARLAVLDETRQGGHALETSIKQLVGGATMVGRNPAEKPFQFTPTFKLHISTNEAPANSPDPAIRNRLALVRWNVGSTEAERAAATRRLGMPLDEYLVARELPGILAWAARGAARWYGQNMMLPTPGAIIAATDEHMAEGDLVAQWLASETFEKPGAFIGGMQGWASFKAWKDRIGERGGPETMKAWGLSMNRLVELDPTMEKVRSMRGIEYRGRATADAAWSTGPM